MKSFKVSRSDREDEPLPGNDRPCCQLSEVRDAGHSQLQHWNIAVSKTECIGDAPYLRALDAVWSYFDILNGQLDVDIGRQDALRQVQSEKYGSDKRSYHRYACR